MNRIMAHGMNSFKFSQEQSCNPRELIIPAAVIDDLLDPGWNALGLTDAERADWRDGFRVRLTSEQVYMIRWLWRLYATRREGLSSFTTSDLETARTWPGVERDE